MYIVVTGLEKTHPVSAIGIRGIFILDGVILPETDRADLIAAWLRVG
jgi:hypothetical protein